MPGLSTHPEFPVFSLWRSPEWLSQRATKNGVSSVRMAPFTVTHYLRLCRNTLCINGVPAECVPKRHATHEAAFMQEMTA